MDLDKIYREFLKIASEYFGEVAAYDHADIQRDKAMEELLIEKGLISKEELEQKTAQNLQKVIDHIKERKKGVISPFQKDDF